MTTDNILYIMYGLAVLVMFIYYIRRRRKFLSAFFGVFSGLAALFLLNKFGGMIGVEMPLNVFNLCGSAVL
ncbi:MAG: pro-sigmaK processing inhibitor BofA family protein, partial [Ruminococcus sp.]|nr:pro-sigmaK processing inhibitor BofA family protein [Ruminococcus sp.]